MILLPTYLQKEVVWGLPVWNILAVLIVFLCFGLIPSKAALAAGMKDIKGHWAAAEIEQAVSTGYVKGYPDGTFRPNAGVTRAEFVVMLDSANQVPAGKYGNSLGDVSARDWFAQDVASALAAGFVSGYPDGTFRPQEEVSRQEAACMLAKLLKLDSGGSLNFSDAGAIASWARPSVSGLVTAGIMTGYPDGTFRPQKVISRAEAVVMINKALALQSSTTVSDQPSPASSATAPGSASAEPSRGNPGTLSVQVSQDNTGTTVDIQGAQDSAIQCAEETDPQRLDVTVTGVSVVRTPLEIDVGGGGLDKIITSVSDTVYGRRPCPSLLQRQSRLSIIQPREAPESS